jgi:polyisoprenoid-binding protein YceI
MKGAVWIFLVAAAAGALAGQPARYAVESDQVLLTYQAALGRSVVSGLSRDVAATVEEVPTGALRVTARVPLDSFESGSPALDALFRAALQADRFPQVEFEASAPIGKRSGQFLVNLEGTLSVHGVAQPVRVPVRVLRDGKLLYVEAAFPVDLASHGVAAPSIGAQPVSPRVQIELRARLQPAGQSAALVHPAGAVRG